MGVCSHLTSDYVKTPTLARGVGEVGVAIDWCIITFYLLPVVYKYSGLSQKYEIPSTLLPVLDKIAGAEAPQEASVQWMLLSWASNFIWAWVRGCWARTCYSEIKKEISMVSLLKRIESQNPKWLSHCPSMHCAAAIRPKLLMCV